MAQEYHENLKAQEKWEGRASAKLPGSKAQHIWPLFEDFLSINKWLPGVDKCHLSEGELGQPGCVRYCSGTSVPSTECEEAIVSWVKEKLLSLDSIQRCLSYEVIDGNVGFNSYVATIRVLSDGNRGDEGHGDGDDEGCTIEWSFSVDPIHGWNLEDLVSYVESSLQVMAKRMEEAVLAIAS